MLKSLILSVYVFTCISCGSKHNVSVYKCLGMGKPYLVTGNNLEDFFNDKRNDIVKYELSISNLNIKKLEMVKDSLKKGFSIEEEGDSYIGGFYEYAFIHKKDILYSSGLIAWKYKNKIALYRDIFVGNEFEKNNN